MKAILGKVNGEWLESIAISNQRCERIDAAVAYCEASHKFFDLCKQNRNLINLYILVGPHYVPQATLLERFLANDSALRGQCRLVYRFFHTKVIWWRGIGMYIGSANLTHAAWNENFEAGMYIEESEANYEGWTTEIDDLFTAVHEASTPVTSEIVAKVRETNEADLSARHRKVTASLESMLDANFPEMKRGFSGLAREKPRVNAATKKHDEFVAEWRNTLQLLRNWSQEFLRMRKRPVWLPEYVHPTLHFDQFLHGFYYERVRGNSESESDNDAATSIRVEQFYERNKNNPALAVEEAADWWASLPAAPHNEDAFILEIGPQMQTLLSRENLTRMTTAQEFYEAVANVHALRNHARQVPYKFYRENAGKTEVTEERVRRFAYYLWNVRNPAGRSGRDLFEFIIWGSSPTDMEERLWIATNDPAWKIERAGERMLGEAVGWARPDEYPPRNNRTNKSLRSLGFDVRDMD